MAKKCVLIVDDDDINRLILRKILTDDYTVVEAPDGQAAVNALHTGSKTISAVLLDIFMPVLDGYHVLSVMRNDRQLAQIPVIAVSASTNEATKKKALSMGATDFLKKPYDSEEIKLKLANLIRLRDEFIANGAITRDKLTGILNRDSFLTQCAKEISSHEPGYYILSAFDVDKFNLINDRYGSRKGDEVLIRIAEIIKSAVDFAGGLCGRINADNFALLIPAAYISSERINEKHREISLCGEGIPKIIFSVGRYLVDNLSLPVSVMYDRALMAKASVKGKFNNLIGVYNESMRERVLRTQTINEEMIPAIANGEFEAWYQPQYNNTTGALIGAEALARWRHPERGMISPADFIPVFEQNGFIFELDKYIWERACAFLRKSLDETGKAVPISVNMSRHDVVRDDMISVITGLVAKYRLPIELLRLEITESAFADKAELIIENIKELVKLGFTVEIDDFGSGYSSLNTLKDVPAQIIKLDMRFIEGKDNLERGGIVIESVIRMARWLGMSVIAEGTETVEQIRYLRSIGCIYSQGFFFGKPMSEKDYTVLLANIDREEKLIELKTVKNLDNNAFWDPKSMDTLMFNSYAGAASILEYSKSRVSLIRGTDAFSDLLEKLGISFVKAVSLNWADYMAPDDLAALEELTAENGGKSGNTVREYTFTGLPGCAEKVHLRAIQRVIATVGDCYMIYCINEDITAQREAEERRRIAESKEHDANERARIVMAGINGGVSAVVTRNGKTECLFANDNFYNILGYTKEQFESELPNGLGDALVDEDRQSAEEKYHSFISGSGRAINEFRARKRDGSIVWLHANGSICSFEGIEEPVNLAVYTDITKEKLIARKISDAEKLEAIINNVNGGMAAMTIIKGEPTYMFLNDRYCEMFGYTREQFTAELEHGLKSIVPEEYDIKISTLAQESEEAGKSSIIEFPVRCRNGRTIWVRAHSSVSIMASYATPVHICILDDITGELESKRRIEKLNNDLSTMMADIPGGFVRIYLSEKEQKVVYINDGFYKLVAMKQQDVEEKYKHDLFWGVHPDDLNMVKSVINRLDYNGGTVSNVKFRLYYGPGGYIGVSVFGRISTDEGGRSYLNLYYTELSDKEKKEITIREAIPFVLAATMDSSNDIVFAKDKNLNYIYGSPLFVSFAGCKSVSEIIGKNDFELFPKAAAMAYREGDLKLINTGSAISDRTEPIASDDRIQHYASISKYILRDSANEIIGVYGIGKDVTDIRIAYNRLSLLNESIPGGLASYIISPDGIRLEYFNDGYCRLFGVSRDEYENSTDGDVFRYIHPDDLPALKKQVDLLVNDGAPVDCTYRVIKRSDPGVLWINLRGVLSERNNNSILVNAVLYDVTAIHEAEQREKDIAEQMTVITQNINSGVSATVCRGGAIDLIYTNEMFYTLFGYTKQQYGAELPGGLFDLVHPEDLPFVRKQFTRDTVSRDKTKYEFRAVKRDGTHIWIRARASYCLFNNVKEPVYLAILHDITREKEDEKKLCDADEILRFLNNISHDIVAYSDAEESIRQMLNKILMHFGGSRAYVFEKNDDGVTTSNTYEVCSPGISSEIDGLQCVPNEYMAAWYAVFEAGGYISIENVNDIDDSREDERRILSSQNIKSLVAFPFRREGVITGFLGIDDPTKNIKHTDSLGTIGDYLTVMLIRRDYNRCINYGCTGQCRENDEAVSGRKADEAGEADAVKGEPYDKQ